MKNNNVRKGLLTGVIISFLILVGFLGSYAYFISVGGNNKPEQVSVQTGNMALTFNDGSDSFQGKLNFGDSATKSFTIENTGSLEARGKLNWYNLVNTYLEDSLTYTLSYSETEDGEYTPIIENKNVPVSATETTETLADNLVIPVGKTYYYKLVITLNYLESTDQTADLNAMLTTQFKLEEGSIEPEEDTFAKTLLAKANAVSKEYESGNKAEMYTFEHEATDQTPALTDYRYIGAEPKNYITFNDETWRIIGVFSTEDEEGNFEPRVKIIRDEFLDKLPWDRQTDGTYTSDWSNSTLYALLNKMYPLKEKFNYSWYDVNSNTEQRTLIHGLNTTASNQIASAKWYLGGTKNEQNAYSNERSTTTCATTEDCEGETRNTNVIAKVGLMYPSDFIYSFSGETSDSGWLYNTELQWSITNEPASSNYVNVMMNKSDWLTSQTDHPYSVRPCVYLRADIQIIDGDGSSSSPYTISE